MYSQVTTAGIHGLHPYVMQVETDLSGGLPAFSMVGFLSREVREAADRVRAALRNSGYEMPAGRITVSFTPSEIPKRNMSVDLPVAAGLLIAMGVLPPEACRDILIIGELGLDGSVRPVRGILPMMLAAKAAGLTRCLLPYENLQEASLPEGIRPIGVRRLKQAIRYLLVPPAERAAWEAQNLPPMPQREEAPEVFSPDLRDIHGHETAKRMLEVAAAGFHNLLLVGPPGSGKSMLVSALPGILPPLEPDEQLEVSSIYSIAGELDPARGLITHRPFVAPHHSVTGAALTGGTAAARPGVLSLGHRGVLFLDELPEFGRAKLDLLRQPMEEGTIRVDRVAGGFIYPARTMVAAAMNPCPCGYYPDRKRCSCTDVAIHRYLGRISGPFLDRMDLSLSVEAVDTRTLMQKGQGEESAAVRARVMRAAARQKERFVKSGTLNNASMTSAQVDLHCVLTPEAQRDLPLITDRLGLSARALHRTLKVARTIADLDGTEHIDTAALMEALSYRMSRERYWKGETDA